MKRSLYQQRAVDRLDTRRIRAQMWRAIQEKSERTWAEFLRHFMESFGSTFKLSLSSARSVSGVFAVVLLLVLASTWVVPSRSQAASFELSVSKQAESDQPVFTLKSKEQDYDAAFLHESLEVYPRIAFEVVELPNEAFEVKIQEALEPNVVYRFKIEGEEVDSFGWTYEVPEVKNVEEASDGQEGVTLIESNLPEPEEELMTILEPELPMEQDPWEPAPADENDINHSVEEGRPEEEFQDLDASNIDSEPADEAPVSNYSYDEVSYEPEPLPSSVAPVPAAPLPSTFSSDPVSIQPVETVEPSVSTPSESQAESTDVCVADLQSFSDAVFVAGPYAAQSNYGEFLVQEEGVFDALATYGHQLLVLAGGEVSRAGNGGVFYIQGGVVLNASGPFTAYVKADGTLRGSGNYGTIYYESGALIRGFGDSTVYHECSKIVFVRP